MEKKEEEKNGGVFLLDLTATFFGTYLTSL